MVLKTLVFTRQCSYIK